MGDWSSDGHGKTDNLVIKSNLTVAEINEAYKRGTKIVGFDFCDEVAKEYEDRRLSNEHMKLLVAQGYDEKSVERVEYDNDDDDYDGDYSLWTDSYPDIWLFIVKLGNPNFKYEEVVDSAQRINIGGYGLFY
jgi:phosphopantothenoylcysteine synthetase/decarboxylase